MVRELAVDAARRQPRAFGAERDVVVEQPELQLVCRAGDPCQLLERARRDDRLEVGQDRRHRGLLDSQPVRVRRGHHDLAGLELHEDPGQDRAALVTRRATADARDGLDEHIAVDRVQRRPLDVRQAGKVLRRVGVQPVVGRARRDEHGGFLRAMLDRHLAVRQRARDVEQQAPGNDRRAFAFDRCVERRAQRELHVGGCEVKTTCLGAQLDAAEHEHCGAGRNTARDDREPRGELVLRDSYPEPGAHYGF